MNFICLNIVNEIKNEMPVIKASDYIYTVFVPTFQAELLLYNPPERVETVLSLCPMLKSIFVFFTSKVIQFKSNV